MDDPKNESSYHDDRVRLSRDERDLVGTYLMLMYAEHQRAYDSILPPASAPDRSYGEGMRKYHSFAMSCLKAAANALSYARREYKWRGAKHCFVSDEWRMCASYIDSLKPAPEDDTDVDCNAVGPAGGLDPSGSDQS